MSPNLRALNNFIGYGDPKSPLWFIGIDEHGEFKMEDEQNEIKKLNVFYDCFENSQGKPYYITEDKINTMLLDIQVQELKQKADNNPTYSGILEIFNNLFNSKYTGSSIGNSEVKIFLSNLFPIGRDNTSDNSFGLFVEKYFLVSSFDEWKKNYWEERIDAFNNFIKEFHILEEPKVFICLGVSYQIDFQDLLRKIFKKNIELIKHSLVTISDKHQSILCYHPSKRNRHKYFTDTYVRKIVNELKKSPIFSFSHD